MSKHQQVLKLNEFKQPRNAAPDFYIRTFQEHKAEHPFVTNRMHMIFIW